MSVGFDEYAKNYDAALDQGLSATGESKDYFARHRVVWLSRCLQRLSVRPERIMDYGCGTGSATNFLFELLQPDCAFLSCYSPIASWEWILRNGHWNWQGNRSEGRVPGSWSTRTTSQTGKLIWPTAMECFITFRQVSEIGNCTTSGVRYDRAACFRFGRTTRGIRERGM